MSISDSLQSTEGVAHHDDAPRFCCQQFPDFMNLEKASEYTTLSERKLEQLMSDGKLKPHKVDGRNVFARETLKRMMDSYATEDHFDA